MYTHRPFDILYILTFFIEEYKYLENYAVSLNKTLRE